MSSFSFVKATFRFLPLVLVCGLAACGFRLQGSSEFPAAMANTFIDTKDRYTPFYRDLSIALEQNGVNLTASPLEADAVLQINNDETGQRVLTVSSRNVPSEYDVYYRVTYSVYLDGEQVVSSRSLTRNQDYTFDSTKKLGKDREADEIRTAISKDIVRQVTYELGRLKQ
jgi:LPS-assembly lipoprotein